MMIGVVGLGVLGRTHRDFFVEHEHEVFCNDIDPSIPNASNSLEALALNCELIFVCVPTPPLIDNTGEWLGIDHKTVIEVVRELKRHIVRENLNHTIVVRSTVGMSFFRELGWFDDRMRIVYLPEFLTERFAEKDFRAPHRPYVLGLPHAQDARIWSERLRFMNKNLWAILPRTGETANIVTYAEAVAVKLATNAFYAMKVMFGVTLDDYVRSCHFMTGADNLKYEKVTAVLSRDPRIGSQDSDRSGRDVHLRLAQDGRLGFGGKCLPKDLAEMLHYIQTVNLGHNVLSAAWKHNNSLRPL